MRNDFFTFFTTFIVTVLISLLSIPDVSAQCRADVSWTGAGGGVSVSGTTITKTGGTNGSWSAGAYDLQPVGPGGYVQFRGGDVNKYKMLGLNSDPASNRSYCTLDYSWYLRAQGYTQIYESCGNKGSYGGDYNTSDVFKIYWNPFNNKIEYYKNGVLEYTSATTPSATLYVDCSIYYIGGSFTDVTVAGGDCLECAAPVIWRGEAGGATANGTTITKTGGVGNSWSTAAYSLHPIGPGGFVQFQPGETNTYKMIGLNSDPTTNDSYNSIDYAWYPRRTGDLYIYENGSSRNIGTPPYSTSDIFKVYWNPTSNRIEYYKNKTLMYTSTIVPSGTYYVDISLYTSGASFKQVIVQGGDCSYSSDFF